MTPDEEARYQAEIRNRIVSEIKLDQLKREIIQELGGDASQVKRGAGQRLAWIPKFFAHTGVLLVLGFILTGVMGSALTAAWQDNSWITQQSLLANQRVLDRKYELASDLAKQIGDTHAAPTMVLLLFTNEDTRKNRQTELPKRVDAWRKAHAEWITNYNVLLQRITVYVRNPEAHRHFQKIINFRKQTNNDVLLLLSETGKESDVPVKLKDQPVVDQGELKTLREEIVRLNEELTKQQATASQRSRSGMPTVKKEDIAAQRVRLYIGEALLGLNNANEESKKLMEVIRDEIKADSNPPRPSGFWSVLRRIFG